MDGVRLRSRERRRPRDRGSRSRPRRRTARETSTSKTWRAACRRRQVPAVVGGVEGPGEVEAAGDRRHEDERAERVRRSSSPERRLGQEGERHDREEDREADGGEPLERVDGLIADHAQRGLQDDDDREADRERDRAAGQGVDGIGAEEGVDRVPGDRAQPVDDARERRCVLPNGSRAAGIWAIPVRGPIAETIETSPAPITLPTMIARTPSHQPSPTIDASVPTKNAAGTRFGVNQTVKSRLTDP